MTEIEISGPAGHPNPGSPYRNLLVPLVVVPAMIVMVLVVVFVLFGALAGEEKTPSENLRRLLEGGSNEQRQAAFNLVSQFLQDREARAAGRVPEWHADASLLPELLAALEQKAEMSEENDVPPRLALAIMVASLGGAEGVSALADLTRLPEETDPRGEYRWNAAIALGSLGADMDEASRIVATRALVAVLESPDSGLRSAAVIALQGLSTPEALAALRGALADGSLEIRGNAALSLARHGSAEGAAVLREMLSIAAYDGERERDPRKWTRGEDVGRSRRKALSALAQIGAPPPRAQLEELVASDPDPGVRELARALLGDG
jgi:HEAT repeat protein